MYDIIKLGVRDRVTYVFIQGVWDNVRLRKTEDIFGCFNYSCSICGTDNDNICRTSK